MIFCIDIDDTIINLNHVWLKWFNRLNGTSYEYKDINSWGFWDDRKNEGYDAFSYLEQDKFWEDTIVYPIAVKTIEALIKSGHQAYLVTATNPCYKASATKITHTLRPFHSNLVNADNVIITYHKCLLNGDILIDDKLETVEQWLSMGRDAYLPTQPWNRKDNANINCIDVVLEGTDSYCNDQSWIRLYNHFVDKGYIKIKI